MRRSLYFWAGIAGIVAMQLSIPFVYAQTTATIATSTTASDLQAQIDQNNAQINQLNTEIAQYQTQLDAVSAKKQTLQTTVSQLNLSIKKTTTSIQVTKKQISTTQLQIQQLQGSIQDKQQTISTEEAGLAESIRALHEVDNQSLAVALLTSSGLTGAWEDIDASETLQNALDDDIVNLSSAKQSLTVSETAAETKQTQLVQQQTNLSAQQGSLSATRDAQSQLLVQTKSQESTYEQIIAQKKAQEVSFENALNNLKAQFNEAVNPDEITAPSPGILQWPIAGTIRITQYFGDTPFADTHAALYSGHGHDGLDIGAPIGTPVHAALNGTILATGNTDLVRGCYSFGKWVMIKHDNGLNTMYAHLSEIDVTAGQQVNTGDVIGYSGETGYATGPHLHFGVYVSSVTQIIPLGQATNGTAPCSRAVMPVPPVSGYLNPLNYLPTFSSS
jgi:murein DD-endopeptidase MepM/ murein hydrolase activator NlpD